VSGTVIVGLAQIAPVLLDRAATLAKVVARVDEAGDRGCDLVAFGEALVPGYPVWLSRTDAARFEAADQKELHALYSDQAVQLSAGHLDEVCAAAARRGVAVVLGVVERADDRGGHSLYCSRVFVEPDGSVGSVHRKLMPTYEERLAWAQGDGAGLVVHRLRGFTVGALNCWENWLPLARVALHAQGEDLHLAIWPGGQQNTADITRYMAREGRSFVLSVSGLLRAEDVPLTTPHRARIVRSEDEVLFDGGSAAAGPDGSWLLEPVVGREELVVLELDHARVREERQNFDYSGHYGRPDVFALEVDRRRQQTLKWRDDSDN